MQAHNDGVIIGDSPLLDRMASPETKEQSTRSNSTSPAKLDHGEIGVLGDDPDGFGKITVQFTPNKKHVLSRQWMGSTLEFKGHDHAETKSLSRSIPTHTNSPAQKSTPHKKVQREVPVTDASARSLVRVTRAEPVSGYNRELAVRLQSLRGSRLSQLQRQLDNLTRTISLGLPVLRPRSSPQHKPSRYAITASTGSPARLSLVEIRNRQDEIRKQLSEF